jgi:hypothetical protein
MAGIFSFLIYLHFLQNELALIPERVGFKYTNKITTYVVLAMDSTSFS